MDDSENTKTDDTSSLLSESFEFSERITGGESDEIYDTRSELKFDRELEDDAEKAKRVLIEKALEDDKSSLQTWKNFAISEKGLVGDDLRRKIWPLLLEVDPSPSEVIPSLEELSDHSEYTQVVLDVNRSLKRFPPGIPLRQRLALQDQLTVLILRVIIKYPHLRYYQGYHDVAITFLLVAGETVAFRIMERLSTDHLRECMEPTMEKTSYRLNYIYSLLYNVDRKLHDFMDMATVGTMFALPWFLTWFGHSLNQYRDVVRLYDFFLANEPLMPLYVAASLVIERREEVFAAGCDMASIHCLLSQIPDDLDFEVILQKSLNYYRNYPPKKLEKYVKKRIDNEIKRLKQDEARMRNRRNKNNTVWLKISNNLPGWLVIRNKYGFLFATAAVLLGYYMYYVKNDEAKHRFFSVFNT